MVKHRISIVGTGYVGLCTAVGFASKGYSVTASTHDQRKVDLINKGVPPFHEPDLKKLLRAAVKKGYLKCVFDRKEAVLNTDITFVAVGTPSRPDGSINLQHIKNSSQEIGRALGKKSAYHIVAIKSTIVPGTSENVVKPLLEKHSNKRCGTDFGLCMNPEFLREGSAIHDTLHPDRIIIGEYDKRSGENLQSMYQDFYGDELPPIVRTNLPTAEFIKYANNAFLATKISFINQMANICERIPDVDVTVVAKGIGLDERIGPLFLKAGLGYGGSCLPKDIKALIAFCKGLVYDPVLINAIEEVNNTQPYRAVELARKLVGDLQGKRVAVLGLAFKPNTDDMREAVSVRVVHRLLEEGASVVAYDPVATANAKKILGNRIEYASSVTECLSDADCCILVTEWDEFKELKPENFIKHMKSPVMVDGRRILDPEKFRRKVKLAAIGLGESAMAKT